MPLKYGSRTRPVRSRTLASCPSSRSLAQRACVLAPDGDVVCGPLVQPGYAPPREYRGPPPDYDRRRDDRDRLGAGRVGAARAGEAGGSTGVLPYLPADGAVCLGGGAVYDVSHDSAGSERLRKAGSERAIAGHAAPAE